MRIAICDDKGNISEIFKGDSAIQEILEGISTDKLQRLISNFDPNPLSRFMRRYVDSCISFLNFHPYGLKFYDLDELSVPTYIPTKTEFDFAKNELNERKSKFSR